MTTMSNSKCLDLTVMLVIKNMLSIKTDNMSLILPLKLIFFIAKIYFN
jgi:hypothetical protein